MSLVLLRVIPETAVLLVDAGLAHPKAKIAATSRRGALRNLFDIVQYPPLGIFSLNKTGMASDMMNSGMNEPRSKLRGIVRSAR